MYDYTVRRPVIGSDQMTVNNFIGGTSCTKLVVGGKARGSVEFLRKGDRGMKEASH